MTTTSPNHATSWKTSPVTVVFITFGVLLAGLAVFGFMHGRGHRRHLVSAVTHQMDPHSANIATLLSEVGSRSASQLEDAVYEELQRAPSTSLIAREMVSVRSSTGNVLECVIDTASLGLQARLIQQARVNVPKP